MGAETNTAQQDAVCRQVVRVQLAALAQVVIEGNWRQLKGHVREQWGKLTDDQFDNIAGKRDRLAGSLQKSYGIAQDEAEKQIKDFEEKCDRNRWIQ